MRNISDADGLSREKRLERFVSPVALDVLEDRFTVLLARALRHSEFFTVYHYQPMIVLWEIEHYDTHAAAVAFRELKTGEEMLRAIHLLYWRLEDWQSRLEYACLEGVSLNLLKDLRGQVLVNIIPGMENLDSFSDDEHERFYLLLLDTIRLLYHRREIYRNEINTCGFMDPSLALLVAFLHNYGNIAYNFNMRWRKLPEYYVNELLRASFYKRKVRTTWLSFEKSPVIREVIVAKGTCFQADNGENEEKGYRLLSDIQLTDMQIKKISEVVVERNSQRYPEAALGYVTSVKAALLPGQAYRRVPIGIRIHSAMLWLAEGQREVDVRFSFTQSSLHEFQSMIISVAATQEISTGEALYKILSDSFLLRISTETGERDVTGFHIRLKKEQGLLLTFRLSEEFPAIVPLPGDEVPGFSLLMNPEAWMFPYSWACRMLIQSVRIRVSVKGLRSLDMYNELGKIDVAQAFAPFGIQGDKGSWLIFGNYEMARKPVKHFDFIFNWQNLPVSDKGLADYYKEYNKGIDNRSFHARIEFLQNKEWKITIPESHYLFRTSSKPVPVPEGRLISETMFPADVPEIALPRLPNPDMFRPGYVRSGFYRLILEAPDMGFGTHEYRRLFAEVMMRNSHRRKPEPLPEAPLNLLADEPRLNYVAEAECLFKVGKNPEIKLSYIRPLSDQIDTLSDTAHPVPFINGPQDEGNLMIGIVNAVGENLIRLYLEMELLQREIDHEYLPSTDWYYRAMSGWVRMDLADVLRDDTGGLMHSGAVTLQLPFCVTTEMTDKDGLFWICLAVHANLANCSVVKGIYANVAEAELVSMDEPVKTVPGLQSFCRVGPLDKGPSEESILDRQARMSERISRRKRILLPKEFEQAILQEFPEIVKVKCLPGVDAKQKDRRNLVTLAVIHKQPPTGWPLCTDELLCRIEEWTRQYASPFAEIDAINPVYEEITVFCGVSLKEGQAAGAAIAAIYQSLKNCIAPWNQGNKIPVFGYSFSMRDIQSCVKESGVVKSLEGMKIVQVVRGKSNDFKLKEYISGQAGEQLIQPSCLWGILVPAPTMYVKVVTADEWQQDVEFGDLEIGNTFVIK